MLCVEDYLDSLKWAAEIGGLESLIARSMTNLQVIEEWVDKTPWIDFLAESADTRSNTSVCLKIVNDAFEAMPKNDRSAFIKDIATILSNENIAHDISAYKDAPPGFRFWCGPTIEPPDVKNAIEGLERVCSQKLKNL
jgi:phosphoserine aminotransferase